MCGEPQACKTPIKWLEAAAESVAVVAGPELYEPWLQKGRYGLFAKELSGMVPLARQLLNSQGNAGSWLSGLMQGPNISSWSACSRGAWLCIAI